MLSRVDYVRNDVLATSSWLQFVGVGCRDHSRSSVFQEGSRRLHSCISLQKIELPPAVAQTMSITSLRQGDLTA
jgi:hypothetical protein